jgi:hypothetical protein
VPVESVAVLNCADPPVDVDDLPVNVADPTTVCESRNVMLPVGVTVPAAAATFAVNVTPLPAVICVADRDKDVLVLIFAGGETVTATTAELEAEKFGSPAYAATIVCEPVDRVEIERVAVPEVRVAEPSALAPSLNVTVPVGVPLPDCGATVAVNFTVCPVVSCVLDAVSEVSVAVGKAAADVNTKTVTE